MEMKIAQLERHLPDGVVITAHWVATKQDGFVPFDDAQVEGGSYKYTASAYGSIGLPAKDPSDPTFVAYDQLTEAQAIIPEAVTGEKDGEDMQAIDQSKLVPLLTAALQDALKRIEALEAQLNP